MEIHSLQLSNGIPLIVVPTFAGAPTSLQVWFLCGSRAEKEDEAGLAHLDEHLFFKGGDDFPDERRVERELRLLGGKYNALTSRENVFYFITSSPRHLSRAAHLLSDMLIHARMDEQAVKKECKVITQELNQLRDNPEDFAESEFTRFIFGDNPLGREMLGTKKTLRRFTAADAKSFKRFCGPPNGVITVVGDIELEKTTEILEERFGRISQKEPVNWLPFRMAESLRRQP